MAYTPIPALPPAPSRSMAPDVFIPTADAFVAALPGWGTAANTLAGQVDGFASSAQTSATNAGNSASAAAGSASAASGYANTAMNSPGTQASSVTSLSIGTGGRSLTLQQTGKAFSVGQWVYLTEQSNPSVNWMQGTVSAFNSGAGTMTVNIVRTGGSGTYASWYVMPGIPAIGGTTVLADANNTFTGYNVFNNGGVLVRGNMGSGFDPLGGSPGKLQIGSTDGGPSILSLVREGVYGINLSLLTNNRVVLGGWSAGTTPRWQSTASGDFFIPAAGRFAGGAFSLTEAVDNINGAPWYGIGRTSTDLLGSGGTQVQLAGFYGLILAANGMRVDIGASGVTSSGAISATQFHASDWFRTTGNTGLYSTTYGSSLHPLSASEWRLRSGSATAGVFRFYSSTDFNKGSIYWDTDGFGLISDTGSWLVRGLYGSNSGGFLNGPWNTGALTVNGSINATTFLKAINYVETSEVLAGSRVAVLNAAGTAWDTVIDRNGGAPIVSATSGSFSASISAGRVIAGFDAGAANSMSCANWFRSSAGTGWLDSSHGGGIYCPDNNTVAIYNSKLFKVNNRITAYYSGATNDPGGIIGATRPADSQSRGYFGMTKNGVITWVTGITADNAYFFAAGSSDPATDYTPTFYFESSGRAVISGRVHANGGGGNGLGSITLTTSDSPSGGSQGDFWAVY